MHACGLVSHFGSAPSACSTNGPAGLLAVKIRYSPLLPLSWYIMICGWSAAGFATCSMNVAGTPSTGLGTYDAGFLSAARFASSVVEYTALPAAQHVDEYIVILPFSMTGDPKYCAVVSAEPSFF